jgi:hypothetical protein
LAAAEHLIRDFLVKHGDHVEAMRLLARIGIERDVLDDAELLLEASLMLAPDYHAARSTMRVLLIKRHKYARRANSSTSCSLDPRQPKLPLS